MFAARGIAVSFSVFMIVYCALSAAVCFGWRKFSSYSRKNSVRRGADLLFSVCMLPLAGALAVSGVFSVSSFFFFEPRALDEPIGPVSLAFRFCGGMVV